MTFDGTWESVGSEFRDRLREAYAEFGEEAVYAGGSIAALDGTRFRAGTSWAATEAIVALKVGFGHDVPAVRNALIAEFSEMHNHSTHYEDERDVYADRLAITAMRAFHSFRPTTRPDQIA